jgi:hypothetical protein
MGGRPLRVDVLDGCFVEVFGRDAWFFPELTAEEVLPELRHGDGGGKAALVVAVAAQLAKE